jgi:hypothetical protein
MNMTLPRSPVELTIRQIEPSGQPGVYLVAGSASLPDRTKLTITAVRYLHQGARSSSEQQPLNSDYSILDRQTTSLTQENWKTNLSLWQVAPDGKFQEAWQLSQQNIGIQPEPADTVTFLATLDPLNQPSDLKAQIESEDDSNQARLVRFTTDGEMYLQVSKTRSIALPTGGTTPPPAPVPSQSRSERSQTSGNTDTKDPSSQLSTWSKTNAPLLPDQFLQ